ncbi:MAG TPA: hypothetical protein VFG09_12515 [Thermodesulfovibrionales bacterium]|jgi:uncharacterized membrane protein YidH (DUF202 family)|nr:hypothetical protein [Thermodesulfovibrionales bacterium]
MMATDAQTHTRYRLLVDREILTDRELSGAAETAAARGVDIEQVLVRKYGVSRLALVNALADFYNRPFAIYDERMPIAPELLSSLDGERLSMSRWFPLIKDGGTVIIAANNPEDPLVLEEVRTSIKADRYEFWVALDEDIQWFIQDFLHAKPGYLIGTERTGLAFWRNTMAQWRTRLACYRNDLAKARTDLAFLRWGLGMVALSDALLRTRQSASIHALSWVMLTAGLSLATFGLAGYLRIRKSRMTPPGHQTLVEVTAATLQFLENYHFIEGTTQPSQSKQTMLARLGDFLADHCTILYPSPASKERTHLARERNVLAGQRTVAACYRTIYARARTGLAFIRTGVSFAGLGLGLIGYFATGLLTIADSLVLVAGILLAIDGLLWYIPVRKEQSEIPRCPVPQE